MRRIRNRAANIANARGPSRSLRSTAKFRKVSQEFFAKFSALWPGALADPYDLLLPFPLPDGEIAAIKRAAAAIGRLYRRTFPILRSLPREALLQMGLSESVLDLARINLPDLGDSAIARLDLVRGRNGYKLLDFNADVPGLLIETFSMSSKVCEEHGVRDPNRGAEHTFAAAWKSAIYAGLKHIGKTNDQRTFVAFPSHEGHVRDQAMARYLVQLLDLPDTIHKSQTPPAERVAW